MSTVGADAAPSPDACNPPPTPENGGALSAGSIDLIVADGNDSSNAELSTASENSSGTARGFQMDTGTLAPGRIKIGSKVCKWGCTSGRQISVRFDISRATLSSPGVN